MTLVVATALAQPLYSRWQYITSVFTHRWRYYNWVTYITNYPNGVNGWYWFLSYCDDGYTYTDIQLWPYYMAMSFWSTRKIAPGGIWASKSGKTPLAVAEHPDVTPTGVPWCNPNLTLDQHKVTKANTRMVQWSLWCGVKVWGLSGGFTPCRHLRSSSGREHTIV